MDKMAQVALVWCRGCGVAGCGCQGVGVIVAWGTERVGGSIDSLGLALRAGSVERSLRVWFPCVGGGALAPCARRRRHQQNEAYRAREQVKGEIMRLTSLRPRPSVAAACGSVLRPCVVRAKRLGGQACMHARMRASERGRERERVGASVCVRMSVCMNT